MEESISIEAFNDLVKNKQKISILDVRRKADLEASPGKIKGAFWKDPLKTAEWMNAIPQSKEVIVYCVKGGSVSQSVARELSKGQFKVRYLEGGIKAWDEIKNRP